MSHSKGWSTATRGVPSPGWSWIAKYLPKWTLRKVQRPPSRCSRRHYNSGLRWGRILGNSTGYDYFLVVSLMASPANNYEKNSVRIHMNETKVTRTGRLVSPRQVKCSVWLDVNDVIVLSGWDGHCEMRVCMSWVEWAARPLPYIRQRWPV